MCDQFLLWSLAKAVSMCEVWIRKAGKLSVLLNYAVLVISERWNRGLSLAASFEVR